MTLPDFTSDRLRNGTRLLLGGDFPPEAEELLMTENAVLTAETDEPERRPCPQWCAGLPNDHEDHGHFGAPAELNWTRPGGLKSAPLLDARIALLYEDQDIDRPAEVWLSSSGDSIEFDDAEKLERFILEVERFALGLRDVKRRFTMSNAASDIDEPCRIDRSRSIRRPSRCPARPGAITEEDATSTNGLWIARTSAWRPGSSFRWTPPLRREDRSTLVNWSLALASPPLETSLPST
jgi:hypothetical protein